MHVISQMTQVQSNSIIVEKWSKQIFLLYWIFLLFWIFVLFKEIDYLEKAGHIRAAYFYTSEIVVTLCATEGFEKTLDLSLLFEAFSW